MKSSGNALQMNPIYDMDYKIYMLADEKIFNVKYIEENFNDEDYLLHIALNQYHQEAIKQK